MIPYASGEARRRKRLAEAYIAWRNECAAATEAYRRWADTGHDQQATLWEAYESRLEREQRASMVYFELAERVAELPTAVR